MPIATGSTKTLIMLLLGVGLAASALGAPSLPPLVVAVRQANCGAAVSLCDLPFPILRTRRLLRHSVGRAH